MEQIKHIDGLQGKEERLAVLAAEKAEAIKDLESTRATKEELKEVAPVLPKRTMGVLDAEGMDDDIGKEVDWVRDDKDGYEGFRQ